MPPKKAAVAEKSTSGECILQFGRDNNAVEWREEMYNITTGLYGTTGMFFHLNRSYRHPLPHLRDYHPAYVPPVTTAAAAGATAEDDEDYGSGDEHDSDDDSTVQGDDVQTGAPAEEFTPKFIAKLREGAYDRRQKAIELQALNETKIWALMWSKMSQASQSKVRESPKFEPARQTLDSVRLWKLIRKSHLTHMYGDHDNMSAMNLHDQQLRYNSLRQNERELVADFKTRFDNQLKANHGVGITEIDDSIRALDFISKLDTKRYGSMITSMRNNACQNLPGAYPSTLAAAYRIASTWTRDGALAPFGGIPHAAFLADAVHVTKAKDTEKVKTPPPPKKVPADAKAKRSSLESVLCYVCGNLGHYARDCDERKGEKALYTGTDNIDIDIDDGDKSEFAYITSESNELVLFSRSHVLLDNQASVSIFCNRDLLSNVQKSQNQIVLNGVQANAKGVRVSEEGSFNDVGTVYYSEKSTANILSFASMVDDGAKIRYDQQGRFTLQPKGSNNIYSFCRRRIPGSEGRFYVCDVDTMVSETATDHPLEETALVQTVSDNLKLYTKREVASARSARELLARMGYPSVEEAISMLRDGNDFSVTEYDFRVADTIWGKDIASIKGKTTKRKSQPAMLTLTPTVVQQQQILSIDIMFVEQVALLVAVSHPLDLTLGVILENADIGKPSRCAESVKKCLDTIVATLRSRNFIISLIMSDGEGAIGKLIPYLERLSIEVNISGAGGHVARIERRIRMIKERIRSHICGRLPFALTFNGLSMLALYCISRINYQHSGSRPGGVTPREAFSGQRVAGNRDFRVAFGDYCQCTVANTDHSMNPRTEDCIAYLPSGNRQGSVKMFNLATAKIVLRDNFKVLPMPDSAIQRLNQLAAKDGRYPTKGMQVYNELQYMHSVDKSMMPRFMPLRPPNPDPRIRVRDPTAIVAMHEPVLADIPAEIIVDEADPPDVGGVTILSENIAELSPEETMQSSPQDNIGATEVTGQLETDTSDSGVPPNPTDPTGETTLPPPFPPITIPSLTDSTAEVDAEIAAKERMIRHFRSGNGVLKRPKEQGATFVTFNTPLVTTPTQAISCTDSITAVLAKRKAESHVDPSANVSVRDALRTRGDDARLVINKELQQMIDKRVWVPVMQHKLTAGERSAVIRSSMFLKRKIHPDGSFDKYKARLVAGGDQQNKLLYDDLSSPTVSTSAVYTIAAICAHEHRHAAVVDIRGAFLNAHMTTGVPVHMRLDKTMTDMIIELDSTYKRYTDDRGRVVVLLKRALYGCVESAALWYENLKATLTGLGFTRNESDICVFNRTDTRGVQCTAAVHVDDLLITSKSKAMIAELTEGLEARYGEITLAHGPLINYLGMAFDFSRAGEARVSMSGYIDEMLESSGVQGIAKTPATDWLFETRPDAVMVREEVRVWFHHVTAQLVYLAKRVKPECLTAVAYLATRVTRCSVDDVDKLHRVIRYVRWSRDTGLIFRPGSSGITVRLFVDASYGVHIDGKSHTGCCVVIGDVGAVHCRSAKQGIVSKSSTEAELIGLSDSANQGIHTRMFLVNQGYTMGPVTVYQDNMSCMALIDRGRSGAEKTRHIGIRYFWVKERVTTGEVTLVHKGTKEMYANILTKPLQGGQFVYEKECLTGWPKA